MHAIPDAALDTHIGVLGRTGTGKSYTARGLVERLLGAKRQVVIVDPTGAWWGLRSLFPIPIFGGEHGDVAITDESGKAVAETILTHRTSAIIDLSMLARDSHAAMRRFMTGLVGRLKDRDPGALWLVIDEADEFLPQVLSPDMTRLFGDLKWIVRGRIAGWRVMMVTQRPQDIAKAVLTQIGTLVAHRLTAPQDRKAIEEWVKGHADEGEARQVLTTLASLQTGEAWAWSPDHGLLVRAVMPPIRSFDSGATPDADSAAVEQPELAAIDLSGIRATLEKGASISSTTNAGAKIDTDELARLCARVAELERERDEWTIERAYGQQQLDAIADENRAIRECAARIADAVADTILRRMPDYVHHSLCRRTAPLPMSSPCRFQAASSSPAPPRRLRPQTAQRTSSTRPAGSAFSTRWLGPRSCCAARRSSAISSHG